MITNFDFIAFGCVAVLSPIIIEFIQSIWKKERAEQEQKILSCITTGIIAIVVLFCKAVFVDKPIFDIQYWTMGVLFVIFSIVASQLTFDKLIKVIEQLIVKK